MNSTGGFTPIQFSAIAYGAPDPNASGGVGNLNNFVYVGTTGSPLAADAAEVLQPDGLYQNDGRIFVTTAGGQGWTDISSGLDGSSVVGIYPDPDRGSHAAYAVTLTGVFYSSDTIGLAAAGQTVWTNITSNLTSIQYNPYGNPLYQQSVLAQFLGQNKTNPTNSNVYTAQYGGFTGIVADYRYEIPAPTNATEGTNIYYPVLYVSGYGGVFRSIDNGVTWTVFPNTSFDGAPVDGGYLPSVDVTNLQLVLGDINPDTGHATQSTGDPEILLASTFGAGDYAIRLAPDVVPDSVAFDTTLPNPGGSDSSNGADITNVLQPYLDGVSEVSNYGNTITINFYDESLLPDGQPTAGYGALLGTGTTNQLGQFVHYDATTGTYVLGIQIVDDGQDPSFFTSSTALNDKIVGIRATDSSGASGNLTDFKYTLDLITPITPNAPVLESVYDTGRFSNDDLTNLSVPAQTGPGAALSIVAPVFDITTTLPQANPLTPDSISLTVYLLRSTSPSGPFFVIDSTQTGVINAGDTAETYMLTDTGLVAQAEAGIDQTFYYEALQVDEAGNVSTPASNQLAVTVDTEAPAAPTGLTLDPTTNSGTSTTSPYETSFTNPKFDVTGVLPNDQVLLYRSLNGSTPTLVGTGPINTTSSPETLDVIDTTGAFPDGVYTYYAVQLDVYGNYSLLSSPITVTINTQAVPSKLILDSGSDTGRSNSDDVTDIATQPLTPGVAPTFFLPEFDVTTVQPATGQPAITTVQLFRSSSPNGPFVFVGSTPFAGDYAQTMVGDLNLQALANQALANGGSIDQNFYYEADQINAAGIESGKSGVLTILVDTITPPTLPAPTLDPNSNTGLNKSQLITNVTHPTFDATNLLPNEQLLLYRSIGGNAPILVGTGPINTTSSPISAMVTDATGAIPDGVYQYTVVQQDLAGNVSNYSMPITVTINTTVPTAPTINLLVSDDTGLPSNPNVTSVNTPHFNGTAQYNAGTNFPLDIINVATGAVLATTFPAANNTYLAQITTPLADGVYTLEARTTNLAGTYSYSKPLTITIKHIGPQIIPNLQLLPADDTGIKGDGVTANHNPEFIGTTDPGDTVSLYDLINGQLLGPEATTTSSTINGSFSFKLPFNLTDGVTQLVARASDIANNYGPYSTPLTIQIVTTDGDYLAIGGAQLTVFDPQNETYYVRNTGFLQVDTTPGRDVPVQYDYNGDGSTDLAAYRFNTAEYYGYLSNNSTIDQQYGAGGSSLPVSGYYGNSGTFIYGSYQAASATWVIALPQPGGLIVHFGDPGIDIPVPGAYNGGNSTEIAVFRGTTVLGNDADSYSVIGPNGSYLVSFTNPAVEKLGFVYQPGDIPAPADYDGVGRDEFAIYRPSTGQFFILNTPSDTNTATWTLRTVTLNLPGGPKAGDEPVSQDYDGDGKADPTVYRPSNSTFYMLHSSTGIQQNIQFGPANVAIAAAGPLLYRLTALQGIYATKGGFTGIASTGNGGGGGSSSLHALSFASASTSTSSSSSSSSSAPSSYYSASSPTSTMIAVATPIAITTTPTPSPTLTASTTRSAITVGASTPKAVVTTTTGSKSETTAKGHKVKVAKSTKSAKPLTVDSKPHATETKKATVAKTSTATTRSNETAASKTHEAATIKSRAKSALVAVASLQHLVLAKKGGKSKKD